MVEQICEKCGTRYSLYAPACPSCGEPSPQPAKKPGCPQAPAPSKPAAKPAKPATPAEGKTEAATEKPAAPSSVVTVETASSCPCKQLAFGPLALIGIIVGMLGILKLLKK